MADLLPVFCLVYSLMYMYTGQVVEAKSYQHFEILKSL